MSHQRHLSVAAQRSDFSFSLANGDHWVVTADDWDRAQVIPALAQMFQASGPVQVETESAGLEVGVAEGKLQHCLLQDFRLLQPLVGGRICTIAIHERIFDDQLILPRELCRLLYSIAFRNESKRGFLLHGVLLERLGRGVVLLGPSGRGKTTAARRVPSSWTALSDDAVLVAYDQVRGFSAHAWPAGRAMYGRRLTYDVQRGLPLAGIFLLVQSDQGKVAKLDRSRAVGVLCESAKQTPPDNAFLPLPPDELRELRLRRFDNICALARAVPAYLLHLSLTSPFWEEIEHVIDTGQDA